MFKKILVGIISGAFVGMFVTSILLPEANNLLELFSTKITLTSIITGVLTGIYAGLSKSKLQVFFISVIIGILIFYIKYLLTGHNFDSLTMGAFVGAMLGGIFAVIRKTIHSYKVYTKLNKRREKGFGNYS